MTSIDSSCGCVSKINKLIETRGMKLVISYNMVEKEGRAVVSTERLNPSSRSSKFFMAATYCPFCGESYDQTCKRKRATQ
jgi:hypothetical protein